MEKMENFIPFKAPRKIRITPEIISILAILLLGLFLRVYRVKDYLVFLGDEGRDALVVWGILNGDLTLLGPTASVGGFFLGPAYYYLMAPFLWLSRYDPVGPAVMVVLFGVVTIFLVYRFGKELFGWRAGLIASLLYAISPIVITYSRSSWNPNVFPFFTISSLYTLYLGVKKNKWWLFLLSGFLMGINLQIHYLATFVGAIMFIYITFVELEKSRKWIINLLKRYAFLIIGFLVGFAPFIAFEFRHGFTNSQNLFNFILSSDDTGVAGNVILNVKVAFDRLFGGLLISYPQRIHEDMFNPNLLIVWYLVGVLLGIILVGFFIYYFYKNYKRKNEFNKLFLIAVWGFIGVGLFLFYEAVIYDYYLGFLFPLPFLLFGLVSQEFIKKYKKFGVIIVVVVIIILVIVNLRYTPILTSSGNKQADQARLISEFVLEKTEGKPFNFALSGAGNSDHAYRYFFRLADRDPVLIEGLHIDPDRNTVTDQLFVICEQKPCSPLGEMGSDIANFGRADIAETWDVSVVRIYKLIKYEGPEQE